MVTSQRSTTITWLHLSDLHLRRGREWSQDVVLASLLRDIEARYSVQDKPDLLFVTGDVAFSGKEEEYKLAGDFFRILVNKVGIPAERVFVVPGNHDIDRDVEEDAFVGGRRTLTNGSEVERFFDNVGRRKTIFSRQKAFRNFANLVMQAPGAYDETNYFHRSVVRLGPIRIRVMLIDTSWLAAGGEADVGRILVGERQVIDCAREDDPAVASFTFAIMHHPFSWIAEFEQRAVENRVIESADVCLRGHVHSEDLRSATVADARLTIFTAGAAFETRDSDNCYHWCSVDLSTGQGQTVTLRYNGARNAWDASARRSWSLSERPPPALSAADARKVADLCCASFRSYFACLLAGISSEVPVRLPTGAASFVGLEMTLPNLPNPIGELVVRMRHHFYWRDIWDAGIWAEETSKIASGWETSIGPLAQELATPLQEREDRSRALLLAVETASGGGRTFTAAEAIKALASAGDYVQARAVLDHWQDQGVLESWEAIELLRAEVHLLMDEGNMALARKRASELTANPASQPLDLALCALCAYNLKDNLEAARLIHLAIERGVSIATIKPLALKIASAAGDAELTRKVVE